MSDLSIKKILIAIDDSPVAVKVVLTGIKFCEHLKPEIALLSVVDTNFLMTDDGVTPSEMATMIKNEYIKNHQLLIDELFNRKGVWTFVENGKPYEVILKTAEDWKADLIIIGTHGKTGLTHLLSGSVAEKVIRHSTKPLLVVPAK
jgi:nucleotide-binding universal stress UspA family protein